MEAFQLGSITAKSPEAIKKEIAAFEKEKNKKAALYTIISFSLLLLLFFVQNFPPPPPEITVKVQEEIPIELAPELMNLGNDENGALGDLQPLQKGDFAPPAPSADKVKNDAGESDNNDPEPPAQPITDDRADNNNEIRTPPPSPRVGRNPNPNPPTTMPRPTTTPRTVATTPEPARPKAPMGFPRPGGTGSGNGAETDRFGNDGNGFGTGDRGNPGGSVVGNGNLTNLGTLESLASQSGTNYRGKARIKVRVDESGRVSSILGIDMVPASATSKEAKEYVRNVLAPKLKFQPGADGRTGTVTIEFDY